MRTNKLGGLETGRIGLGAMGMSAYYTGAGLSEGDARRLVHRALDLGVTLIDTAEVYGPYSNEELVGRAVRGRRDEVVLATKFGQLSHTNGAPEEYALDSSPANVRLAVEGSLRRLQTDHIDLYHQHRVDPGTPIEETVGALGELVAEGKVRHLGLSEVGPETIRRAHAVHPIAAVQSEYSLWSRDPENRVLPVLRELGIGLVPYSPLGRGFLGGRFRSLDELDPDDWRRTNPRFAGDNLRANLALVEEVESIAREASATPAQIALAWLLAKGDDVVPIPGTTRIARLEENARADETALTVEQVARLDGLAPAAGDRYDADSMATVES
ncbi:aldo/keto reductase [Microlunatus flavus]|uniref:Predicted oxidoreductase n=1 Tax=Microlunatus flavus TaxID=1036181 RepID=A0A1H9NBR2_9ACTN|nr:aldo/keto reductase [Microlunatus flavus]SER33115.1 Predicted oxidoreductase [Microlunatus flavus]